MKPNSHSLLKPFTAALCSSILLFSCTILPSNHPLNKAFSTNKDRVEKRLSGTGAPKPAAVFDVATSQERMAAVKQGTTPPSKSIGSTIASLGSPAETGFWLKTPLVIKTQPGRIVSKETGKSVNVTLIPLGTQGSGSQLSLSAMRLLEVSLTGLPKIIVFEL